MFQFRAFPSYAYLIQRTILEYCSSGFPHSEISGSTDICSSPKLIAACRVLHRLLMPRHSPCALYSLTFVDVDSISLASTLALKLSHSVTSPLQITNTSLVCDLRGDGGCGLAISSFSTFSSLEIFGSLELCRQSQITQNCYCYPHLSRCCPQLKSTYFLSSLLERPLCCLAFITLIHCSVFKVQSPAFVKARNKYSISLNTYFRAYSDWWARVGSNHRPYDYQSYALAS